MVLADLSRAGGHLVIVSALLLIVAVGGLVYFLAKYVKDRERSHDTERTRDT
jgi:hypothetical protein